MKKIAVLLCFVFFMSSFTISQTLKTIHGSYFKSDSAYIGPLHRDNNGTALYFSVKRVFKGTAEIFKIDPVTDAISPFLKLPGSVNNYKNANTNLDNSNWFYDNGRLLFNDNETNTGFYVYDGTKIDTITSFNYPAYLTMLNGEFYFFNTHTSICKSNFTKSGTQLVMSSSNNINVLTRQTKLFDFAGKLYFRGVEANNKEYLFELTTSGVKKLDSTVYYHDNILHFNIFTSTNYLYYSAADYTAGTFIIKRMDLTGNITTYFSSTTTVTSGSKFMAELNNELYMAGTIGSGGKPGTIVFDGSNTSRYLLTTQNYSPNPYLTNKGSNPMFDLSPVKQNNNFLFFVARDTAKNATQMRIWVTDGTPARTMMSPKLLPSNSGMLNDAAICGNTLYTGLDLNTIQTTEEYELWRFDSMAISTKMNLNRDTTVNKGSSSASYFNYINGDIYFIGDTSINNSTFELRLTSLSKIEGCGPKTVGINSLIDKKVKLLIYPNPSYGIITLEFDNFDKNSRLEVYNILGEKVYEHLLTAQKNQLNLALNSGIYFANIIDENGNRSTQKIIIE